MTYKSDSEKLIENLQDVMEKRQEFSVYINRVISALTNGDSDEEKVATIQPRLKQDIQDLAIASQNLSQGRFRLMVLGDMKHGKSTLLNALLGKDLLPRAVSPTTAILTIIQYGNEMKVTVHFKDHQTETLTFDEFNKNYTIDPEEAKRHEESKEAAFPNVNYAVVEYPLEILQNGVELVDSPGLNDTDERNQLTLEYISNCHAILFILNATKPFTMEERRYLENYLKGRGLTIFFLINRWDELSRMALDPNNLEEIRAEEEKQRKVFKTNLYDYCQIEGSNLYEERVFETSGLNALRCRLTGQPLDGTGLPEFMFALEQFLTKERAIAEFRQIRSLMRQTYNNVHEAIALRIPLLNQSVDELKQKIQSVQPEFRKLVEIRDNFKTEIEKAKSKHSDAIAESAFNYISTLDDTFDVDFKPYMPDLRFFSFLWGGQRKKFEAGMKERFQKYVNDRMSEWTLSAVRDIEDAFSKLAVSASQYGATYLSVTDTINAKLSGSNFDLKSTTSTEDRYPAWARFATGTAAFLIGDFTGAAGAGLGAFRWKGILINLAAAIGVNAVLIGAFGIALGPLGIALVTGTTGSAQMEIMRRKFIKATRTEMKKSLPDVAIQQSKVIYQEVKQIFENYNNEVSRQMNEDILSRERELELLIEQKESGDIDRDTEVKRLRNVEDSVYRAWQDLEISYDSLVAGKS